jgi:hypothetical protein
MAAESTMVSGSRKWTALSSFCATVGEYFVACDSGGGVGCGVGYGVGAVATERESMFQEVARLRLFVRDESSGRGNVAVCGD